MTLPPSHRVPRTPPCLQRHPRVPAVRCARGVQRAATRGTTSPVLPSAWHGTHDLPCPRAHRHARVCCVAASAPILPSCEYTDTRAAPPHLSETNASALRPRRFQACNAATFALNVHAMSGLPKNRTATMTVLVASDGSRPHTSLSLPAEPPLAPAHIGELEAVGARVNRKVLGPVNDTPHWEARVNVQAQVGPRNQ